MLQTKFSFKVSTVFIERSSELRIIHKSLGLVIFSDNFSRHINCADLVFSTYSGCLCDNWKPSFLPLLIFEVSLQHGGDVSQ